MQIFTRKYFFKNAQYQTVIDSRKFQSISEFSIITANDNRRCFQKVYSDFHFFWIEWKTNVLRISEAIQHFPTIVLQIM